MLSVTLNGAHMKIQNPTSLPKSEAPRFHHQQKKQMTTFPAESETQEGSVAPSRRCQRRSSVTSYSLEQMGTSSQQAPIKPNTQGISLDPETKLNNNITNSQEPAEPVMDEATIARSAAPMPHKRYGRRNSVTRCSFEHIAPVAEMRSLSPVPLARRASLETVSVEKIGGEDLQHQINTNQEQQPTIEQAQEPPRGRYRRRCSVTQYCLEGAQMASTIAKVTVEEPPDTVDSNEHRKMPTNDTIESAVAGDLIMGWNRAGADYLESDDEGNRGNGELICGFGKRLSSEKTASMSALESETGNYFLGVLTKRFSNAPFWFQTLESEVKSDDNIIPVGMIDIQSSVEQANAIETPSPTQ